MRRPNGIRTEIILAGMTNYAKTQKSFTRRVPKTKVRNNRDGISITKEAEGWKTSRPNGKNLGAMNT